MRRLKNSRTPLALMLVLGLTVAACGGDDDPTGPDGSDGGSEEFTAVVDALASSGALGGFGGVALLADPGDVQIGTIDVTAGSPSAPAGPMASLLAGRQAIAFQYVFDVTYEGESIQGTITGVSAWTGLDVNAKTVDEVVSVLAFSDASSGSSFDLAGENGLAYYIENAGNPQAHDAYFGTSGTFSVGSVSVGGGQSCGTQVSGWSCTYATGTMSGSFNFAASNFAQPPQEITRSSSFSGLPLVRVTVTGGS